MEKPKNTVVEKKRIDKISTFVIAAIIVVVFNIVVQRVIPLRADLTADGIYSLSKPSANVVRSLTEPLTVKVFFTKDLPPPYSSYEKYLRDFLREYRENSKGKFKYEFVDLEKNPEVPKQYNINPVQIRVFEKDRATFRTAYIGAVLLYGNVMQTIPQITSTEGLEYKITSLIKKMTEKVSKLHNLEENMEVILFASSDIIDGNTIYQLDSTIKEQVDTLKEKLLGKIEYRKIDTSMSTTADIESKADEYGIPKVSTATGEGYLGVAVVKGEQYEMINIISRTFFGNQININGLDARVEDAVENLIGLNRKVGYVKGHGEPSEFNESSNPFMGGGEEEEPKGASRLAELISEEYEFTSVNLEDGVPSDVDALIILEPQTKFSEYELYKLDQYLMLGKPVAFFTRGITFPEPPESQNPYQQQQPPQAVPLSTGLERLLAHYGVKVNNDLVLDKKCFEQPIPEQYGGGKRALYFVPIIGQTGIDEKHPVTKNIKGMFLSEASSIEPFKDATSSNESVYKALVKTSKLSWTEGQGAMLNPYYLNPPNDEGMMHSYDLAATIEGTLTSYFRGKEIPIPSEADESKSATGITALDDAKAGFLSKTEKGRFIVCSAPSAALNYVLYPNNVQNVTFVKNIVDWLVGDYDLLTIRSKGLRYNPPREEVKEVTKYIIRVLNVVCVPLLVILLGILLWRFDVARREEIKKRFNK